MRKIDTKEIADKVYSLALKAGISLTPDCKAALKSAADAETSGAAKFALDTLILNSQTAEAEGLPVCQDTGMAVVLLEIGQEVFLTGELLEDAVNGAVRRAYADGYFRKSVCDPITRQNTGDNTPAVIHTHICAGEQVKITFLPKGFGSENMSRLYMLTPSQGMDGVKESIINAVKLAGSNPCPPMVVGVGIGGTAEKAMMLAKEQLLREIGAPSEDSALAALEQELLLKINALGIGAQGFGGDTSALAVHIGKYPTHISALPVAVNIQCNAVRLSSVTL